MVKVGRTTAVLLAIAVLALAACARDELPLRVLEGPTMGTRWSVKVAAGEDTDAGSLEALQADITSLLADINQKMSTWIPGSELSQLNRFGAGEPYSVSADLLEVLEAAETVHEESGGAFDPTVGPLVDLWGFGAETVVDPPDDASVTRALALVGWSGLRLDRRASTVLKTDPAIRIDLSAIAKGYAVDRIAELVLERGHENFLAEIGGEIRVRGHRNPKDQRPWILGIEAPTSTPGSPRAHRVLALDQGALATSGDYRNFYVADGVRYSHTIDPRTGRPVTHTGASVSVHAADCMTADALATALLVMGPDRGFGWAESRSVAALFLIYGPGGTLEERRTTAMGALLSDSSS